MTEAVKYESLCISKVGVIGSGIMGAGIAALVASAGIPVVLLNYVHHELSEEDREKGLTKDSPAFRNQSSIAGIERISNPKASVLFLPEMKERIQPGNLEDNLDLLKDCDWIVEAVVEDQAVKQELFARISPYCRDTAILSTNTSGFSIDAICRGFSEPLQRRFLGTHFYNPPRYMHLLELVPGSKTDPEIVSFMADFCCNILGKGIVIAKDTPGYIGNRIGCQTICTVMRLMQKFQFSVEKVDQLTGRLIGRSKTATFRTLDMVGLDVFVRVTDHLAMSLPDPKEKYMFHLPDFMTDMVRNGQIGSKVKMGFYRKTEQGYAAWDPQQKNYELVPKDMHSATLKDGRTFAEQLNELIDSDTPEGRFVWQAVRDHLLYCARKVFEISRQPEDIDHAMRWGYNWDIGPFELWDQLGFRRICRRMSDEGEVLPDWIMEKLQSEDQTIYPVKEEEGSSDSILRQFPDSQLLDLGQGILGLKIETKGNAVSEELLLAIQDAVHILESNASFKGMVLFNPTKNFLNGADLRMILRKAKEQDWSGLNHFTDLFHQTSMKLKYAKKPVVAAVRGNVLGGGLELAMHCAEVVAHADSYMGLVETGVGIIPTGGGVKEYLLRNMQRVGSFGYNDLNPVVYRVWETIAMAKVSSNAYEALKMNYLRPTDRIVMRSDNLIEVARDEALRLFENGYRLPIAAKIRAAGETGKAYIETVISSMMEGNYISAHDALIGRELAWVVCGGNVPKGVLRSETDFMELEKNATARLIKFLKTIERMDGILATGRPVRN